jgi:hypothetical protein
MKRKHEAFNIFPFSVMVKLGLLYHNLWRMHFLWSFFKSFTPSSGMLFILGLHFIMTTLTCLHNNSFLVSWQRYHTKVIMLIWYRCHVIIVRLSSYHDNLIMASWQRYHDSVIISVYARLIMLLWYIIMLSWTH